MPTKESATASLGDMVKVETEEKVELAKRKAGFDEIVEEIENLEIQDDEDYEFASDTLRAVKALSKEIEARRKKVTGPIHQALEEFRSWYRPPLQVLAKAEKQLKEKIGSYALKKEQEREAQMRAVAAASQKGDFDAAHAASRSLAEVPQVKGISFRREWRYEITDFEKVPREFLTLDHSAIRLHIKNAGKDAPEAIPGLAFEEKAGVTARS